MKLFHYRLIPELWLTIALAAILPQSFASAQPAANPCKIYISEASRMPFERIMPMTQEKETFRITAFCEGTLPEKDIKISFAIDKAKAEVFNSQHGTAYKCIPEGCVRLSAKSGMIAAGTVKASPVEAVLTKKKALKSGEKYLLPITVSSSDAGIDESRGTVFYLITPAGTAKGTEKVLLGTIDPSFRDFLVLDGHLLVRWGYTDLKTYKIDGDRLGAPGQMKIPANVAKMERLFPLGEKLLGAHCTINSDGQLWAFPVDFPGNAVKDVLKIYGTSGYNIFTRIYPRGYDLYCLKDDAVMMLYSLDRDLEWTGVTTIGGAWAYDPIFPIDDCLYGADGNGTLWRYGITPEGDVTLPKKAGSGWEKILTAVPMGTFIIAVDNEGKVWKIKTSELIVL